MRRRSRVFAGWLVWAGIVLAAHYREIGHLFLLTPMAWVQRNYSLFAFWEDARYLFVGGLAAWRLPYAAEAGTRGVTAIGTVILILLAAQVLGAGAVRLLRWSPEDWRERILYQTALGLGSLSYLSLLMAYARIYGGMAMRLCIAMPLVASGVWGVCHGQHKRWRWLRCPHVSSQGERHWQFIVLIGLIVALVGALAPETEWDALWYHLWLPKLWLSQGHPVDNVAEYIVLYPLTWELLFGDSMALGGPVGAKLLHFTCLPLTTVLVYQCTHRFIPSTSPWLAAALFITVPTVLWEATTAYIDLALALHVGLVLYALFRYMDGRQWQWLALAMVNLGLALATKHLALFVWGLTIGGLAVALWWTERTLCQVLMPVVTFAVLSLLLPLPWYIRSWQASGNPFFPELFSIFGAWPPERWTAITERGLAHFKNQFGDPRTPLNLLLLPWNITVHAARYGGNFGPLFLLCIPVLAWYRRSTHTLWLLAFVLGYLGLWAAPIGSFQMRFLVPIVPVLAVLAAEALGHLVEAAQTFRWGVQTVCVGVVALLLFNFPPFTSLHEGDRAGDKGWLTHVVHKVPWGVVVGRESQEQYLIRKVPAYAAWQYINATLPPDARVLTFSGGDHLYSARARIASDATIAHAAVWGAQPGQEQQAIRSLHRLSISHILIDNKSLAMDRLAPVALLQPDFREEWYELVYQDSKFTLFRVW
jgi:hypothetical protein